MALTKVTGQVIKNTTDVTVGVLTVTNTLAVGGTVSIGGTLTYEDVTNVDAVGLITARNGIVVGSGITLSVDGDIFATGVCTATSFVGSGANLTGVASTENIRTNTNATFLQNINVSGSTTTGSLVSSGAISGTTGTFTGDVSIADKIVHTGDTNTAIRFPAADTFTVETGGNERIRVDSDGKLGVNNGAVSSIKAQLDVINTTAPTLDNNTHAGEALFLRSGGSDGNGNVQAVIAFGKADSSSLRSGSAVASVQTDSDADKIGIGFYTSPSSTSSQTLSQKVLITHDGKFGINQNTPTADLEVAPNTGTTSTIFINAPTHNTSVVSEAVLKFGYGHSGSPEGEGHIKMVENGTNAFDANFIFGLPANNGSGGSVTNERMRLRSDGKLLLGSDTPRTINSHAPRLQIQGTDYSTSTVSIINNANDNNGAYLFLAKQRSGAAGGSTIVQDDDIIGQIRFSGADGTDLENPMAYIECRVDGTPGSNDVPARLVFYVNNGDSSPDERFRISQSGQVRMNTSGDPSADLHVGGTGGVLNALFQTSRSSGAYHKYSLGASGADLGYIGSAQQISSSGQATGFAFRSENHIEFCLGGSTEKIRIESNGNLTLNHSASRPINGHDPKLSIQGNNFSESTFLIHSNSTGTDGAYLFFAKQKSGSPMGNTVVANNDMVGQLRFLAADGTDNESEVANITVKIDGTPGSNDTPGRIMFATTNDGGNASTERMRITNSGQVLIGATSTNSINARLAIVTDGVPAYYANPSCLSITSSNSADRNAVEIFQGRYNKQCMTLSHNYNSSMTFVVLEQADVTV